MTIRKNTSAMTNGPRRSPVTLPHDTASPRLALLFIALGLFGMFTTEFSAVGVMPMIVERYAVSIAQAGALVSVFAAIVAICGPGVVILLSRYRIKKVLVGSLLVFCVCNVLSAWAPHFAVLMALRIPSALMLSVFFSAAFVTAVSLFPPQQAARATAMALMGESAGLIFGAPLLTLIASSISYEASFYFCAIACGAAAIGLQFAKLPNTSGATRKAHGSFKILRDSAFWLAILSSCLIFAAIYAVYSYTVEYLSSEGFRSDKASLLMLMFGVGGLAGTYIAGFAIGRSIRWALFSYPILLALIYLCLYLTGQPSLNLMAVLCVVWGMVQMGLIVAIQFLVTSAGKAAPQFATSLFVSSANVGITVGAAASGLWITQAGMNGALWTGWAFCAAALAIIAMVLAGCKQQARPN